MYSQSELLGIDLYSGAGGASAGYVKASFRMVGVDKFPMPHYPYEFIQCDALKALDILLAGRSLFGYRLEDFAFIHASPPCQRYSRQTATRCRDNWPDLIAPTRQRLQATGLPYVIENVPGAPLINPITLCGTMFNLGNAQYKLLRHRLIESSFEIPQLMCVHDDTRLTVGVYGRAANVNSVYQQVRRARLTVGVYGEGARINGGKGSVGMKVANELMGIDWMNAHEICESIPPAYTEYVGKQILTQVRASHVLAA